MTDIPLDVAAFEHGILRIWAFDGASPAGRALIEAMEEEPRNAGPAMEVLGATRVDPYWLDLVRLADISEIGLAGYLRQGYEVPPDQTGALDLPPGADHVLIEAMEEEPRNAGPAMEVLGAARVDPYWLDLVRLADISEMGLAGYLRQGYEVPPDQADALDPPPGADHVLIAPSRAFADHEQTLSPDPALTPLAAPDIHEDVGALRRMDPVETARPDETGTGPQEPRPGAPARRGLRAGAILLMLAIAAAFILVMAR